MLSREPVRSSATATPPTVTFPVGLPVIPSSVETAVVLLVNASLLAPSDVACFSAVAPSVKPSAAVRPSPPARSMPPAPVLRLVSTSWYPPPALTTEAETPVAFVPVLAALSV